MKIKRIERPFEVKTMDDDGSFTGYASVFGDLDSYRDIVMPGAFKKSLASYKAKDRKVPVLWQHNSEDVVGVYNVMKEDEKGLYFEGQLALGVQKADEAHILMKQKAVSGISIGFTTKKYELDNEKEIRKLTEIDLWEASIVTFPALDSARVDSVKSLRDSMSIRDIEVWLRDEVGLSNFEAKRLISCIKSAESPRDEGLDRVLKNISTTLNSITS